MIYIQLLCYLVFVPLLLCNKAIYNLLSKACTSVKGLFFCFIVLLLFAQLHNKSYDTYPFTYWGMYSSDHPAPKYFEYNIELENGTSLSYPFQLLDFTSQKTIMRKVDQLRKNGNSQQDKIIFIKTIQSLIHIYEKAYPEHKVDHFSIISVAFNTHNLSGKNWLKKAKIFEYENS